MVVSEIFDKKKKPLFIIAGPCAIESEKLVFETAAFLKSLCTELGLFFIFKSSFDKANRTSVKSFRGPGIKEGLKILAGLRQSLSIPILTDIHGPSEAHQAAEAVDILQIPAFLCRQTDLITEASKTGMPVNIKKGQFLSPWDMSHIAEKFESAGNGKLIITERGASFGYNNLVVDFRSFPVMASLGYPVVFDVTHSLQLPGGMGSCSGGQSEYAGTLARASVAAGVDGLFMEVHPDPSKALCDGPNMIKLDDLRYLLSSLKEIHEALKRIDL